MYTCEHWPSNLLVQDAIFKIQDAIFKIHVNIKLKSYLVAFPQHSKLQYSFVAAEESELSSFAVDSLVLVVMHLTSAVQFRGQPLLSLAKGPSVLF